MGVYEFTLNVDGFDLDSEFQNAGLECLDYVASVGRTAGVTQVDVEVEASSPELAIARVLDDLRGLNVTARRIDLDLVTTTEVADRLGKSRETVRLWANGKRRSDFPAAYAVGGESLAWAWADVHAWAADKNLVTSENLPIPTGVAEAFTGALAQTFVSVAQGWMRVDFSASLERLTTSGAPLTRPERHWQSIGAAA